MLCVDVYNECIFLHPPVEANIIIIIIRAKFSRLREVMLVLTSDIQSPQGLLSDSFLHLTTNEVSAFIALRIDKES